MNPLNEEDFRTVGTTSMANRNPATRHLHSLQHPPHGLSPADERAAAWRQGKAVGELQSHVAAWRLGLACGVCTSACFGLLGYVFGNGMGWW